MAAPSSAGSATRPVCLLCCRLVDPRQPRCPAFALAGVAAHAGCCGGCTTDPAPTEPTAGTGVTA